VACNLSFFVKNEGVLKVTGSHVHFRSSVLKTVLDKDVETTVHNRKWYAVRPFNSSNCDNLGCMSRSFINCKLFCADKRVVRSLCYSRASCLLTTDSVGRLLAWSVKKRKLICQAVSSLPVSWSFCFNALIESKFSAFLTARQMTKNLFKHQQSKLCAVPWQSNCVWMQSVSLRFPLRRPFIS